MQTNAQTESSSNQRNVMKRKIKQDYFSNVFSFKGRISILEFYISIVVAYNACIYIDITSPDEYLPVWMAYITYVIIIWALLAQGAKRCHDFDKSGWCLLIPLYIIIILFHDGNPNENKYGPVPAGS